MSLALTALGLLAFMLIGLATGLLVRPLLEWAQGFGRFATALLGMVGAVTGGLLGSAMPGDRPMALEPPSVLSAVLGAFLVILVSNAIRLGNRRAGF